jgi:hypothetical protein
VFVVFKSVRNHPEVDFHPQSWELNKMFSLRRNFSLSLSNQITAAGLALSSINFQLDDEIVIKLLD